MANEMQGGVIFYRQPEPLSPEAHGALKIRLPAKPFAFAADEASVPLLISEFTLAANSNPIIFVGPDHIPMAVMGLPTGGNLSVSAEGRYDSEVYIPAFIRRYPFVTAAAKDGVIVVCLDIAADHVSAADGDPLFDQGEVSTLTRNAVSFLDEFELGRLRTMEAVKVFKALDLFEDKAFEIGVDGTPRKPVFRFQGLSETKLAALEGDKLQALHRSGLLAAAHAHIISLNNWTRIVVKAALRPPALKS